MTKDGPALSVLLVATKAPWPPVDGGRLLVMGTLELLRDAGAEVTCVAPCPPAVLAETSAALAVVCRPELVPCPPAVALPARVGGLLRGLPLSPAGHRRSKVAQRVTRLLAAGGYSLVHAEQVQATPQTAAARERGVPLVVRAQNVESALWQGAARSSGPLLGGLLRWEARRLERWEGRRLAEAALTVALTEEDGERLASLAPGARVETIPVPFPAQLPVGDPLPGAPAILILGSAGWRPNRVGAEWFLERVWPRLRQLLPAARVHLFTSEAGPRVAGVQRHGSPGESRTAFADGGILVVPLTVASGVRMKILEAWARGVPVVATPAAASGLGARHGEELLLAEREEAMVAAVVELHGDAGLRHRLVTGGRELLRRRHARRPIAARYLALYRELAGHGPAGPGSRGSALLNSWAHRMDPRAP